MYRFENCWYWRANVQQYAPFARSPKVCTELCPRYLARTRLAGVTMEWKWSEVGKMVEMPVRMAISPAVSFNGRTLEICCKWARKADPTASGKLLARE